MAQTWVPLKLHQIDCWYSGIFQFHPILLLRHMFYRHMSQILYLAEPIGQESKVLNQIRTTTPSPASWLLYCVMAMDQMRCFISMWQLWWHVDWIWWMIIADWALFSGFTVVQLRHLSRDEDQSSTQPKLGA